MQHLNGYMDHLNSEFKFTFDPCPLNENPEFDGLSIDWGEVNFCNPPYGRALQLWMKKGFDEWCRGKTVVFLVPSRTDTRWWHEYCMQANEIRFVRGRLRFNDSKENAPFPSAIVVFHGRSESYK